VDQLKASISADEAMIETAQTNLDYTSIIAPSDGRIGVRLVDPGNIVHASDQGSLATLVLTQPSAVMFTLPARSLDDVRDAMARGPVEVTAYDQDNRQALATGKLLLVDNIIDQTTATIRLKAMFPNSDERLWPGEFVNARVLVETRANAVVVPSAAVQRGPDGLFIWVVAANDVAQPRPIEVGPRTEKLTIINSGLTGGERIITDGQYKLQRGAPVTYSAPATAGAGSNT
jgi:multidrug efflux system membrane fusion protein